MKSLVLSIIMFQLILVSCNQKDNSMQVEKQYTYDFKKVRINEDFFPTGGQITIGNKSRYESMVKRVHDLSSIKAPSTNERSNLISKSRLIQRYNAFLSEHSGDSVMVGYFRHKYASMLLVDYEIVKTTDLKTISFLVQELISSKYGNYTVIIEGLEKVKTRIDQRQFRKMVSETDRQIAKSLANHKIIQERLPGITQGMKTGRIKISGNLRKEFVVAATETDDVSTEIAKLEKYRTRLLAL